MTVAVRALCAPLAGEHDDSVKLATALAARSALASAALASLASGAAG